MQEFNWLEQTSQLKLKDCKFLCGGFINKDTKQQCVSYVCQTILWTSDILANIADALHNFVLIDTSLNDQSDIVLKQLELQFYTPSSNLQGHITCNNPSYTITLLYIPLMIPCLLFHESLGVIRHAHTHKEKANKHIDGLVQERCNSIANTLELCISCTNQSIYNHYVVFVYFFMPGSVCPSAYSINSSPPWKKWAPFGRRNFQVYFHE